MISRKQSSERFIKKFSLDLNAFSRYDTFYHYLIIQKEIKL